MTNKAAVEEAPKMVGLGLDSIGDLSDLLNQPDIINGPLELPLELIDEDPKQPRTKNNLGFSVESLTELANTIRTRGVKTPISVREHPEIPERYMVNHGARRVRASVLAKKTTVPAFIDNDFLEADQVIENLQRNGLTAREIADFIGRELARGAKKGAIAKSIGKSPAFVTQHVTLLDLPDPIAQAFNTGRATDVTVVNELVTAYKQKPEEVAIWLADESQELTRGSVKLLREFLNDKHKQEENDSSAETLTDDDSTQSGGKHDETKGEGTPENKAAKEPDPNKLKKAIVQVEHDCRPARLILNRRPSTEGWAWLNYEDDGQEFEADLAKVQLTALLEG